MGEMVLVELAEGDWTAVRVPRDADVSDFRDYIEYELGMNTRGSIQVTTVAALKRTATANGTRCS